MDIAEIIIMALVIAIGSAILGYVMATEKYYKKPIGTLRIDSSDPDGPYLFLELETDPNIIKKEKHVFLKVNTKSYISQK